MLNIGIMRLVAQHVGGGKLSAATDVVSWLGAMQAQDLNSAKWAIGVRLPGSTEETIEKAINDGEIIRTHLMRPTWHFVAAADYPVILELTAPNVRATLKSRRKQLELTEEYFKKSNPALERILSNQNYLTREELMKELSMTLPQLDGSRMNHVLLEAELDGLICSGKVKNRQHSFALMSERLKDRTYPVGSGFHRDEALAMLAYKYFSSHGPATINDFNWWSGLSMTDCRKALELVKEKLSSESEGTQVYWFAADSMNNDSQVKSNMAGKRTVHLLPAFDEFIISYKDRSAVLKFEDHSKTVSDNGIFRPVIVLDGQVIGLWTKSVKKKELTVEPTWFIAPDRKIKDQLQASIEEYSHFLDDKK